jgi:hypothetical protein
MLEVTENAAVKLNEYLQKKRTMSPIRVMAAVGG